MARDPREMTNGAVEAEMDRLYERSSRHNARMIERGWGNLRLSEISAQHAGDPDVERYRACLDRIADLRSEAAMRYGPGYRPGVTRLPRGGPRSRWRF